MTKTEMIRVLKSYQTQVKAQETALWGLSAQIGTGLDTELREELGDIDPEPLLKELDDAVTTAQNHADAIEHVLDATGLVTS